MLHGCCGNSCPTGGGVLGLGQRSGDGQLSPYMRSRVCDIGPLSQYFPVRCHPVCARKPAAGCEMLCPWGLQGPVPCIRV